MTDSTRPCGKLAAQIGRCFPLMVCQSAAGFYIGTHDENGLPCSRESEEYWRKEGDARQALEHGCWTQKLLP